MPIETIFTQATQLGLFALLFCFLFMWVLSTTGKREERQNEQIKAFTEATTQFSVATMQMKEILECQQGARSDHERIMHKLNEIKDELRNYH